MLLARLPAPMMFAQKFIIFAVIFTALLTCTARADVAASFNMHELTRSYGLSCAAQTAGRRLNIQPSYFPGRPQAFRNDEGALAVYSPYLTSAEREMAARLFSSVPEYALPIIWRGGGAYVFTRRGIAEAVPALAVERNWFDDYGLYMEVERRLYVPLEKGDGIKRKRDRTYAAQHWTPTKRDQYRTINHETGHMIDSMLGAYSIDGKGADGKYRLSNRADYLAAFTSDISRLASKDRPVSIERVHKLGYYMPRAFDGVRLGIQDEQRARREVFAELWAEAHGYDLNKLSAAYPDTFRLVKTFAAFLKAQDAAAPERCLAPSPIANHP